MAKSLISIGSALLSRRILAIFLKCFLVIIYQRVCLYKGFSTRVEKGAQLPHHLGVADSVGWGHVATFNVRAGLCHWPFAITCQATPLVPMLESLLDSLIHLPLPKGAPTPTAASYSAGDSWNIIVGVGCNTILLFSSSLPFRGLNYLS